MRVSVFTDSQLDHLVVKAEGNSWPALIEEGIFSFLQWGSGGPIIEREHISAKEWPAMTDGDKVIAWVWGANKRNVPGSYFGDTPLQAAMRCYVAFKFGEELPDIPQDAGMIKQDVG